MFMPLVETAIAFSVVMLAASLFVSAIVHLIEAALMWRGESVRQILATLMHGFDGDGSKSDAFAEEILGSPLLHDHATHKRGKANKRSLTRSVDYLHPEDLINIVHRHSKAGAMKSEWTTAKAGAPVDDFAKYVHTWYTTVEATHAQAFKRRVRRLTAGVSCAIVVLFCLDGLQLIKTLWSSRMKADAVAKQAGTLVDVAARLDADTPKQLGLELEKTATILDEAQVGIGWQNSWMTRRWCAYKGACSDPPPTRGRLIADVMFWLFGLAFSCVLLSLGAPFWVSSLSWLIRAQNEVQARRQIPPPPGVGAQATGP
jgi:hypothetical protein